MEISIISNNKVLVNWESKSPFTKYGTDAECEVYTGKIIKNKSLRIFVTAMLGCSLYINKVLAAQTVPCATGAGIDRLGFIMMALIKKWGYWIILIACLVEVVRAGASGDSKKILSIILRNIITFAAIYLVPEIFDAIKTSF